ncbi:MAG: hypothetical protein NZ556_04525, partial [Fimbriimonadales bacterium]|nr:hypothetical protein [Fimbriimonadales bacterium]
MQLGALIASTLTLLWGIELLRRQDPFLRTLGNLPPELQNLELYLERPTLTLRDGTRTLATLQLDALEIERNRVLWRARTLRRAVIYDEWGKPIGVAHAQELLYNYPAKRLQIAGNPTLLIRRHPLGDTPLTVQTAQLSWDLRRQQLRAELPTYLRWREGQGTVQTLHWNIAAGIITLQQTELRVRSAGQQERAQPLREVQIRAGKTRLRKDHSEVTDLWLKDGDTIATAERADLYDRRSYALATGKLRLEDPRVDIEGKQLEIWYGENQKRALLRNQIRMRIKPRETQPPPEGEEEDEIEQA